MLQLIVPDISHKEQWGEIIAEWDEGRKNPMIFFHKNFHTFFELQKGLQLQDNEILNIPKSSCYFLLDVHQEKIVGFFTFRHNLNYWDDSISGGHIGYGIRPTERGKGYATKGLGLLLQEIKKLGFPDVYIRCDDDNIASAKVIETNGGILRSYSQSKEGKKRRRYWINLK